MKELSTLVFKSQFDIMYSIDLAEEPRIMRATQFHNGSFLMHRSILIHYVGYKSTQLHIRVPRRSYEEVNVGSR